MPSTESENLRPGAGLNEVELFVVKTREQLSSTMDDLRERFDLKTRGRRAYESLRRDYEKDPKTFQLTGIGIAAVGVFAVVMRLAKGKRNG